MHNDSPTLPTPQEIERTAAALSHAAPHIAKLQWVLERLRHAVRGQTYPSQHHHAHDWAAKDGPVLVRWLNPPSALRAEAHEVLRLAGRLLGTLEHAAEALSPNAPPLRPPPTPTGYPARRASVQPETEDTP